VVCAPGKDIQEDSINRMDWPVHFQWILICRLSIFLTISRQQTELFHHNLDWIGIGYKLLKLLGRTLCNWKIEKLERHKTGFPSISWMRSLRHWRDPSK
jgi:hypothetical protein